MMIETFLETKVTCPLPNSEPQRDKETGNVVECMHRPCTANYRCVFASYGRGKYICCSKPKPKPKTEENEMVEEEEEFYGEKTTTKGPWVPPPPRPVDTPWTPDPRPVQNNMNWPYNNNNNYNNWGNWNSNYNNWGTNWANRNWGNQNWNSGWGRNNNWNNYNYGQQWNNGHALRRRKLRPQKELGKGMPSTRSNWIVGSRNFPRRLVRKRPKRPFVNTPFVQHHPGVDNQTGNTTYELSTEIVEPEYRHSWTHAIKVLIYWCCTNKPCIYRDHLDAFCSKILDTDMITQHLAATEMDEYMDTEVRENTKDPDPSFPINVV
uniref:WAP domain-containing protein n=1 Tax=Bursaphelenchus xylophilus TaxID=6326 RepID=A0A1I7SMP4_BURXY